MSLFADLVGLPPAERGRPHPQPAADVHRADPARQGRRAGRGVRRGRRVQPVRLPGRDAFTKITLYLAAVWVLVIMIHVKVGPGRRPGRRASGRPSGHSSANHATAPEACPAVLLSMTGFGEAAAPDRRVRRGRRGPGGQQPLPEGDGPRHRPVPAAGAGTGEGGPPVRPPRHPARPRPGGPAGQARRAAAERRRPANLPRADSRSACRGGRHPGVSPHLLRPACSPCPASPPSRALSGGPPEDEWPVVERTLEAGPPAARRRPQGGGPGDGATNCSCTTGT